MSKRRADISSSASYWPRDSKRSFTMSQLSNRPLFHQSVKKNITEREARYDRQLRLWDDKGQLALEAASICVLNSTAASDEMLKNLILPGIGSFTMIDDKTTADLTTEHNCTFFTTRSKEASDLHGNEAVDLLKTLNENLSGSCQSGNILDLSDASSDSLLDKLASFDVVIAFNTTLLEKQVLSDTCWKLAVPTILCDCYGFWSVLHHVSNFHCVIDSHPENFVDLRLLNTFPSLVNFCKEYSAEDASKKSLKLAPWPVVLYHMLDQWVLEQKTAYPETSQEKRVFKDMVSRLGDITHHENLQEAYDKVNTSLRLYEIPANIRGIFCNPLIDSLNDHFMVLCRALRVFATNHGRLPYSGGVPDMTCDTESFVKLQAVYRAQAAADLETLTAYVGECSREGVSVSRQEIAYFSRTCHNIHLHTRLEKPEFTTSSLLRTMPELCDGGMISVSDFSLEQCQLLVMACVDEFRDKRPTKDYPKMGDLHELKRIFLTHVNLHFSSKFKLGADDDEDEVAEACYDQDDLAGLQNNANSNAMSQHSLSHHDSTATMQRVDSPSLMDGDSGIIQLGNGGGASAGGVGSHALSATPLLTHSTSVGGASSSCEPSTASPALMLDHGDHASVTAGVPPGLQTNTSRSNSRRGPSLPLDTCAALDDAMKRHVTDVELLNRLFVEVCRYGGRELHPVAAIAGGVAAQEVVKVVTNQYEPVNNCFVFNGVMNKSCQIRL